MFLMNCFCDVPLVEFFRFPVFQAGPWGTVLDLDDCAHKGGAAQGAVFIMSDMQHTVLNRPPDTNSLSICKASRREFFSLMSTSHIHLGVDPHRSIKTLLRSFTMHKGSWLVMSCVCDGGYYRPTSQSFPRNHARVKDPSKMTSLWRSTDAIALTQPNAITHTFDRQKNSGDVSSTHRLLSVPRDTNATLFTLRCVASRVWFIKWWSVMMLRQLYKKWRAG